MSNDSVVRVVMDGTNAWGYPPKRGPAMTVDVRKGFGPQKPFSLPAISEVKTHAILLN